MSIFDLVFLAAALAIVATLVAAVSLALAGRRAAALRLLRALGIGVAVYVAIGLAVSFFQPQKVMDVGSSWCFDDWCLAVQDVQKKSQSPAVIYRVQFRIFSRARRVDQAAKGAWMFLIDEHGNRYAPEPDPADVPLDVRLQPGESISTARVFRVPANVQNLGLITGHGGPYCGPMDLLVIGASGCVFHKPTMIRLP